MTKAKTKKEVKKITPKSSNSVATRTVKGKKYVKASGDFEYWNPKKGDSIEGTYIETMIDNGKFGKQSRPVLESTEGVQVKLPGHTALIKYFEKCAGGEEVLIECEGEKLKKDAKKGAKNSTYTGYQIFAAE